MKFKDLLPIIEKNCYVLIMTESVEYDVIKGYLNELIENNFNDPAFDIYNTHIYKIDNGFNCIDNDSNYRWFTHRCELYILLDI